MHRKRSNTTPWTLDTFYSDGLLAGYFVFDPQALHFEVEAPARKAKRSGRLRDVTRRALECGLDHVPLDAFDGGGEADIPGPPRSRRFGGAGKDRGQQVGGDHTTRR